MKVKLPIALTDEIKLRSTFPHSKKKVTIEVEE